MLLGGVSPILARPLLARSRADLEQFVSRHGIRYIVDESNSDIRYSRNALRHKIAPALDLHFPGYQRRIARVAEHAQAAQRLLNELAAQDLQACADGDCIDMSRFRQLGGDRQDNLLRYWFSRHRVRMPSTSWLSEMRAQLLCAKGDAQVRVVHPDCEVRRHRNKLFLMPRENDGCLGVAPQTFCWNGQMSIQFSQFGGSLHFDDAEEGVDAEWLAQQVLEISLRRGGEKLKVGVGRPTRSLKHHYQALDIPVWERQRLPLVFAAGRIIFAAGIGMNRKDLPQSGGRSVCLRWEKGIG